MGISGSVSGQRVTERHGEEECPNMAWGRGMP